MLRFATNCIIRYDNHIDISETRELRIESGGIQALYKHL